ncbi:alpha-L-rhamnosidase [Daejeonella sp. H1SJ63]|uniref:alpha-L-rhamnosidase n=1 Tax=Daejeonella sp. H1SJ63 TaxID=3034145 RepID=UPI0023EAD039|nr:alpha-L-rhamnosidase [Daejeonella sp. H1SJ63]
MKKHLKTILALLFFVAFSAFANAQLRVQKLLCENLVNPIGIDALQPRFSWQLSGEGRNLKQTAYELKVLNSSKTVWNSGKVSSDQSVFVEYAGKTLEAGKKYTWQVKVYDQNGKAGAWSEAAFFRMGMISKENWKAQWITPGYEEDSLRASPLFRKQFKSSKKIIAATANITSHGMYEAFINGKRIGDAYLTPGWTSYSTRLQYQSYDVTSSLRSGDNAIGVVLGNGWYRGIMGFSNQKDIYGKDLALLFQLEIEYSDGSKEQIISDGSWKSSTGAIVYSEIYNGETIDARKAKTGWNNINYNDRDWTNAGEANFTKDNLIATENEPVKKQEKFNPVKIFTTPKGEKVIDFGQNLVGWVVMKAKGNPGDRIVLSHAEVLDKQGNFYTDNLRAARAQNTYILKGGEEEIFEPHFTWQGFRYLRVEGISGELNPNNFTAVALYSDMATSGTFKSSNPMVNQLQHNIRWGQRGNFLDVPTDCPQRDERLGWTGDAQVFSRTAAFNMNVHSFFSKWLKDLEADQIDGQVPHVVPNILGKNNLNSTGWADVATIIPWNLYLAYGDKKVLETQYSSMRAYVESIRKIAKNDLWNSGSHYGDWLYFRPVDDDNDGRSAVTDKFLIAQCFYAHSTQLLINAAQVLNRQDDVQQYTELLKRIKTAFMNEYVSPNGRLTSGTQTAYVLALNFDMLPENQRKQAADRLAENIKTYGHLTTGFLGTPYLCHVLTRFGYTDLAYKLLLHDKFPSWLYPVRMGATTIWERWDGIKPNGTFQSVGMNSFNHYAYGAIGDWMYRKMVGIDTFEDGVGYKHIRIQPHIGGGFSNASASLETYYGKVSNEWKLENGKLKMDVSIPVNTFATIYIPAKTASDITESGRELSKESIQGSGGEYVILKIGSGNYHFEAGR